MDMRIQLGADFVISWALTLPAKGEYVDIGRVC
jgi:hypothetical protein